VDLLAAEHARGRTDHHVRIWQLASLDEWFRIYIDADSASSSIG
jgi:hypothetical protein